MRNFYHALTLAGSFALAAPAQAQVGVPVSPAPPATSAPSPLLTPDQLSGSNYKTYLNQRYANDREARAIVHLFGRKKTGGIIWLVSGAAFLAFVTSQTGTTTTSSGTRTVEVTPLGYAVFIGVPGGVGIGKLVRFSNTRLYEALLAHESQQPVPDYVTNKLKNKDYK